jgi:membrane protease YdiL (CAAX protease family)
MPDPPRTLVAMVLVGNSLPGMLFGWLFWRRGLEAAMIAHALAHLFAVTALSVLAAF